MAATARTNARKVHGVFVVLPGVLFQVGGPLRWEDAHIALPSVAGVQIVFLLAVLPGPARWRGIPAIGPGRTTQPRHL
jgi:hypothetical protein